MNPPEGRYCDTDNQPCTNKGVYYFPGIGWLCKEHYDQEVEKAIQERNKDEKSYIS